MQRNLMLVNCRRVVSLFALQALLACSALDAPPTAAAVIEQAATNDALTFTPQRDAAVRASAPDTNFGSSTVLDLNRTVIAFDPDAVKSALGPTDYVVSASLELTLTRNTLRRTPTTVSAFRLTQAWTETGVTWDCATDADPSDNRRDCAGGAAWSMDAAPNPWATPAVATAMIPPALVGKITLDVSADVRSFVAGQTTHFG